LSNPTTKPVRVIAVASAGGHWVQLMRLRAAWQDMDVTFVSTDPGLAAVLGRIAAETGNPPPPLLVVAEANRWQKLRLAKQLLQLTWIMVRKRPDAVVTTGAAPGYFSLRLAKLLGARTIWIDSIANTEELSLSGQKVGRYADLWLTQWPDLARPGGPTYIGAVL
jgi:UDP-N-acetylglucosamine:LPS N-acetylglucosamine transferase